MGGGEGTRANSKDWFTTSFLWRKVPKSGARSVGTRGVVGGGGGAGGGGSGI